MKGDESHRKMYVVLATKRSGHHAFIEWICNNSKGDYVYLNDISTESHHLESHNIESRVAGKTETFLSSEKVKGSKALGNNEFIDKEVLILSYENSPFSKVLSSGSFLKAKNEVMPEFKKCFFIIFIRDPVNALASMQKISDRNKIKRLDKIKKKYRWPKRQWKTLKVCLRDKVSFKEDDIEALILSWKNHARLFLGDTPIVKMEGIECFFVSYNMLLRDQKYRANVALSLGLENDEWFTRLSTFGGGGNTPFGDKASYTASIEELENRWESLGDSSGFKRHFRDGEFYDLAYRYYEAIGLADKFHPVLENLRS